jgi:UDP:flavonoid glycosyltransferase YjiC (YdhE family)
MSSILVCAMPLDGHVSPMLDVSRILIGAGHSVRFITGRAYAEAVAASGAVHVPLPDAADITGDMLDAGRERNGRRLTGIRFAITNTRRNFIATFPAWLEVLDLELERGVDLVVGELTVFTLGALCALPRSRRPPVISCGAFPVVMLSSDTAPPMLGMLPRRDLIGRTRNRILNTVVIRGVFRSLQSDANAFTRAHSGHPLPTFLTEWPRAADAYVQFTVLAFEYPRTDAPSGLVFVGPLPPTPSMTPTPSWWLDVEAARTVVHVSQGTLANRDFGELVLPTLQALADDPDVLVVVATGGRPVTDVGSVPANARAAPMLDYEQLMPHVDVFVTNGGYGSLHAALRHGVPIVAAGDTEEKVETCARVGWSGVGLNLRTGTPTPAQIKTAVREVRENPAYQRTAQHIAADIHHAPGAEGLLTVVDSVIAARGS